jgi:hypothetical protein
MMRHVRGRPPSGERLRELRELWQSQHANDIEVAAARRRFALGPRHYRLSFGLRALAGLSVVVLLSGVAVAGAGVSRWIESRAERARASAAAPPLASGRSEAARVRGPLPTLQPLPELPALSTSTPLAGSDPSGATGRGMPVRSDGSARPPAVREGLGGIIPEPLPAPNAPNAPNAAFSVPGAWSRLAEALRDAKRVEARAAVAELVRSGDPATRDAALLVGAQLDLADGQRTRAATTLAELAERGATPVIRERARALIEP